MAETMAEYYARKAREEGQMIDAIHENAMKKRRAWMESSPGSYSQGARQAVDNYFQEREQQRRFDESQKTARGQWGFTDADGTHHAGGAEKVAEYDWMGKRDAGSAAAGINAEATKYGADKTLAGIQAQAQSALEIAKQKAEAEKWIAGKNADVTEGGSRREWGYTDEQGTYHPGGRVEQAKAQGEAAAKIAEQNNQARIEQERIKAQAKERVEKMKKNSRIATGLAQSGVYRDPQKAQEMLEALAGAGLTDEEAAEIIERRNKQQSGQGTGTTQQPAENARSQKIRNTYQQRGMGV